MNNRTALIYAWLVFVIAAKPLADWLMACLLLRWKPRTFDFNLGSFLTSYALAFFSTMPAILYSLAAIGLLAWSFVRWSKAPGWNTLLWTLFTGWVLCGFPGMLFIWFVDSTR